MEEADNPAGHVGGVSLREDTRLCGPIDRATVLGERHAQRRGASLASPATTGRPIVNAVIARLVSPATGTAGVGEDRLRAKSVELG